MATSMPRRNRGGEEPEIRAMSSASPARESELRVFSLIREYKVAVLTSPFWLAAINVVLEARGGKTMHDMIDFLTRYPQR